MPEACKIKGRVAVVMGSQSDFETMRHACLTLDKLGISYDKMVVSAHRTPDRLVEFAKLAEFKYSVVIAGAGGAAHLPGMIAAFTCLPVVGVPVSSKHLKGLDSLLSIVQMPGGVPVCCMSIGESGARNAAIVAASILATSDPHARESLKTFRKAQTESVVEEISET